MGDAVRNYDSYNSDEAQPVADPADAEELFDSSLGRRGAAPPNLSET